MGFRRPVCACGAVCACSTTASRPAVRGAFATTRGGSKKCRSSSLRSLRQRGKSWNSSGQSHLSPSAVHRSASQEGLTISGLINCTTPSHRPHLQHGVCSPQSRAQHGATNLVDRHPDIRDSPSLRRRGHHDPARAAQFASEWGGQGQGEGDDAKVLASRRIPRPEQPVRSAQGAGQGGAEAVLGGSEAAGPWPGADHGIQHEGFDGDPRDGTDDEGYRGGC